MEKVYGRVSLFFVLILLVVLWGFYKTYIIFFPGFQGFRSVHHFHGLVMLLWILMLIIQPLLIRFGKIPIHRAIGKFSFLLAPLLVISLFLVGKSSYYATLKSGAPEPEAIAQIALNTPAIFAFAIFYVMAIANRRNTPSHMRYMIGTSLLMIGPGLGRALIIYFSVPFHQSVNYVLILDVVLAALFLGSDYIRKKNLRPNTIVLTVILMTLLVWLFKYTAPWQAVGGKIAAWFY